MVQPDDVCLYGSAHLGVHPAFGAYVGIRGNVCHLECGQRDEGDSRAGIAHRGDYEPSMDYVADKAHLEWKIRQLSSVLAVDIPNYRKGIETAREIEKS